MQAISNLKIREGVADDLLFILRTWASGLYYGNDFYKKIDKTDYFEKYPIILQNLIGRSSVHVACLSEDPDIIVGYVVFTSNVLHYVYVKKAWRKLGVAKSLLPKEVNVCTHLTKVGASLLPKGWVFNPFLI